MVTLKPCSRGAAKPREKGIYQSRRIPCSRGGHAKEKVVQSYGKLVPDILREASFKGDIKTQGNLRRRRQPFLEKRRETAAKEFNLGNGENDRIGVDSTEGEGKNVGLGRNASGDETWDHSHISLDREGMKERTDPGRKRHVIDDNAQKHLRI